MRQASVETGGGGGKDDEETNKMDPALPKSLDRLLTVGDHLIQPPGRRNHDRYYTVVKIRSILQVCNVPRTFRMACFSVLLSELILAPFPPRV